VIERLAKEVVAAEAMSQRVEHALDRPNDRVRRENHKEAVVQSDRECEKRSDR
jgi:hypothetical protein